MTLLTGEEVRARGLNPDTMISIGGKYDIGGTTPQPTAQPYTQAGMTQQPAQSTTQAQDPNKLYTGEEIRAMGYNPDTQISQGGKFSLSQFQGGQAGGMGTANLGGMFTQPTIDLPQIYNNLYSASGISDIEKKLADMNTAKTETLGKVNDNPYLSEATRVGRVAKIEDLHNQRTADIRGEIATKKADIETKLNLQTKQFDINSQQAQQAISQFNSLLSMGALDNASGDTIANITRATGIDSSMIQSAINANKAKNVKTSVVQSTNDRGEVTISIIDQNSGQVIKQTSLGIVDKATKATGGGSASTTKNTQSTFLSDAKSTQPQETDQGAVGIFPQLVAQYAPYMTLQQIYALYLQSDPGKMYGKPVEDAKEIQELYNYYRGK